LQSYTVWHISYHSIGPCTDWDIDW
jgi:hypothetical protein